MEAKHSCPLVKDAQRAATVAQRLVNAIAGIAWSLATVLAVPVLVCEGVGAITAVRRSGKLFRSAGVSN